MEKYEIKETYDYDMFKKLTGNRVVTESRINKIIDSISKVGYIMNPIIVNEQYEVIDGQARLEALKRLDMPVYYIVVGGAGFKECVSMNINLTNWKVSDYVDSYSAQGNINYIRFLDLCEKHRTGFKTVAFALTLKTKIYMPTLKEGALEISAEEYKIADERLSYLDKFEGIKKINGGISYFQQAIIFFYQHSAIDKKRLKEKIEEGYSYMLPFKDTQTAIESIQDIYNRGLSPENKVFLDSDYKKLMVTNMGRGREAYLKKHSSK